MYTVSQNAYVTVALILQTGRSINIDRYRHSWVTRAHKYIYSDDILFKKIKFVYLVFKRTCFDIIIFKFKNIKLKTEIWTQELFTFYLPKIYYLHKT